MALFLFCQLSANVLQQMSNQFTYNLNNKSPSPTEKNKIERKIYIADFFGKFLRYGSLVYLVLVILTLFL